MGREPHQHSIRSERDALLADVLDDVARRRLAGEVVDDADVVAAHPPLAPDLAEQLAALRRVEAARAMVSHDADGQDQAHLALVASPVAIPGCELTREVYRGGQAVVYKAFHPATGRYVAVKVMRDAPFHGLNDRARFRREVRILAQLKHPNIVSVHDSGAVNGCHYFVMDYIEGQTLDAFLAARPLSVIETLNLFVRICRAVNAAHLRGVIHRDLKPSNIRIDEQCEPHVLDFGLAKMATEEIDDASQWRNMTMTGQFVGSLPWASPEQAEGPSSRIDLRSDIYSLGVVLYQMLTGCLPTPLEGSVPQMLARIMESEPVRPSRVRREVDEDVDTIVLKCLAKEPERRYQSAAALAEDVERYLNRLPILARGPSTTYQLRKLIRRHRLPFALLVALCVTGFAFAVGMGALYARARSAEAGEAKRRIDAEREAKTARAIQAFLVEDLLASAKPENMLGRKVTVEELVANASQRIESVFQDQPEVEASIRSTLGQVYQSLAIPDAAELHYRRALELRESTGNSDPIAQGRDRVALIATLRAMDRLAEARKLSGLTVATLRRALGDEHELTVRAAGQEAWFVWRAGEIAKGRELYAQTLETARHALGAQHPEVIRLMNEQADWVSNVPAIAGSESVFREVFDNATNVMGPEHPDTIEAMVSLGLVLSDRRQFQEAAPLLRDAVDIHRRVLGPDHPDTLAAAIKLTAMLREAGLLDEAETLLSDTVARCLSRLGETHPLTFDASASLANVVMRQQRPADAVPIGKRILQLQQSRYGEDDPIKYAVNTELCIARGHLGRYEEAEPHCRRAVILDGFGEPRVGGTTTFLHLVRSLAAQGKAEEARRFAAKLLELRRTVAERPDASAYALNCYARDLITIEPQDLRDVALGLDVALCAFKASTDAYHYNRYTLGLAYEANGQFDRAIELIRRALAACPIEVSEDRFFYESALVRLLEQTGGPEAAEQVYRDTLAARRAHFPEGHVDIAASLFDLGNLLLRHHKHVEAEVALREALDGRKAPLPGPAGDTFRVTFNCDTAHMLLALGRSVIGQRRYAEAEPLLLDAHARLAGNENCHAELLPAAIRELAALYTTRNEPELAGSYQALLSTGADD